MRSSRSRCCKKPSSNAERRALLAKVHIAKKELNLPEHDYRAILERFNKESSAELTIAQLEELVKFFKHLGWKKKSDTQVAALRPRVIDETADLRNGAKRLPGLMKRICGTERLEWCRNAEKLERLLVVIRKLKDGEA